MRTSVKAFLWALKNIPKISEPEDLYTLLFDAAFFDAVVSVRFLHILYLHGGNMTCAAHKYFNWEVS